MVSRPQTAARSWSRALVLGAATLLAGLAVPGTARAAGCVHDSLRRTWQAEGVAHFDELMASGALAVPAGVHLPDRSEASPLRPKPVCSGPMCSSNQGVPTPPVVSITVEPSPWAVLSAQLGLKLTDSTFLDAADDCPRPSPVAGSVFHPPRSAFA